MKQAPMTTTVHNRMQQKLDWGRQGNDLPTNHEPRPG